MARPLKIGVDYFPLDVDLDVKTKLLKADFGVLGYGILIRLYQLIYKENGYYIDWDETLSKLFSAEENIKETTLNEIISASIKLDLFSKELFGKYHILTSKGIQKRYLQITKRRQENKLNSDYMLLNAHEIKVIVNSNSINDNNNSINVNDKAQSKVKESKVKNTKKIYGVYKRVKLTDDELEKLKSNYSNYQELITFLDEYIAMKGDYKVKSHYLAILRWVVEAVENGKNKKTSSTYEVPKYETLASQTQISDQDIKGLEEWLKGAKNG